MISSNNNFTFFHIHFFLFQIKYWNIIIHSLIWAPRLHKSNKQAKLLKALKREQSEDNIKSEISLDSSDQELLKLHPSLSIKDPQHLLNCQLSSISSQCWLTPSIPKRPTRTWLNVILLCSKFTPELTKFKSRELSTKSTMLNPEQWTL